jgi:hypothetical protein
VFVIKFDLEPNHTPSFTSCIWSLYAIRAELNGSDRDHMAHKAPILTPGPLQKNVRTPEIKNSWYNCQKERDEVEKEKGKTELQGNTQF